MLDAWPVLLLGIVAVTLSAALHHYAKGCLRQWTERDIECKEEFLVDSKPTDIPKESSYLLEISFKPSKSTSAVDDAYWVLAMKAPKITR